MSNTSKPKRDAAIILIAVWVALNILLMLLMLLNDYMDLNNWIELVLLSVSIACLLSMRKWGIALALFTLIYTLSTSVGILIYNLAFIGQLWPNALRIVINATVVVYLFKSLFEGKFK
jgi:hypothetical protein